jgi:hypothetical protein
MPTAELKLVVWSSVLVVNATWWRSESAVAQKERPLQVAKRLMVVEVTKAKMTRMEEVTKAAS